MGPWAKHTLKVSGSVAAALKRSPEVRVSRDFKGFILHC